MDDTSNFMIRREEKMKSKLLFGIIPVMLILTLATIPVLASPAMQATSKPFQLTTDPHYDRNPSFLQASDGTYWLFFTRGRDDRGVRDFNGYDPDSDYYDIYYKTARSIPQLQKAPETIIPGTPPDNAQRDIAALQSNDGTIWVFTSTGHGPGSQREVYYYTYANGEWSGPTAIPDTYAGHVDALEYDERIWVFFDDGWYTLKVTSWDGTSWSGPILISEKATIAKAIVDGGKFYVVWSYIDPSVDIWGGYIGLSTSGDGTTWTNHGQIALWLGATNWDPVLIKDRDTFRLFWAPDAGPEGQFIATSTSKTPTVLDSWSTPVQVTTASCGGNNWWDFWPEPFLQLRGKRESTYLFYISERNSDGTARADGNIWVYIAIPVAS